jgi:hypothetical protein
MAVILHSLLGGGSEGYDHKLCQDANIRPVGNIPEIYFGE